MPRHRKKITRKIQFQPQAHKNKTGKSHIVKLQSKVQTSVLGLGVDFVLPLSQQQEQEQEQQEEPHQNIPEGNTLEVLDMAKSITNANQTRAAPLPTLTLPLPFSFLIQELFETKFYAKIFLEQKFHLNQKLILDPDLLWTQILVGPKNLELFGPKIFLRTNTCFWSKNFWTKNLFEVQIFLD